MLIIKNRCCYHRSTNHRQGCKATYEILISLDEDANVLNQKEGSIEHLCSSKENNISSTGILDITAEVKLYTNAQTISGKIKNRDFLARDIDTFFREKYKGF